MFGQVTAGPKFQSFNPPHKQRAGHVLIIANTQFCNANFHSGPFCTLMPDGVFNVIAAKFAQYNNNTQAVK